MPAAKSAPARPRAKERMSLEQTMAALAEAGSEQTRKTYRRHGAREPLFGVSFATLKQLLKRIGVDHELALALWDTGNYDARNLAVKIVDPARVSGAELECWAGEDSARLCGNYVAAIACEAGMGFDCAQRWMRAAQPALCAAGWNTAATLATHALDLPDSWFLERLAEIEGSIHRVDNGLRMPMLYALVAIGCRNAALREAATAAARRIGEVEIDHGDTACKTPDAELSMDKAWTHSLSKGFDSPNAHERSREALRLRC